MFLEINEKLKPTRVVYKPKPIRAEVNYKVYIGAVMIFRINMKTL